MISQVSMSRQTFSQASLAQKTSACSLSTDYCVFEMIPEIIFGPEKMMGGNRE